MTNGDQPPEEEAPPSSTDCGSGARSGFGARIYERYGSPATPGTVAYRARSKRWAMLHERFPDLASMRVIDVGGYARSWAVAPVRPRELTVVNLDETSEDDGDATVRRVRADACDLPEDLLGEEFDLVYSNSMIEHLGGRWRRQAFAAAVNRLAPHYWIQTPSRTFPIEPHWMFPGFQFLPTMAQVRVAEVWPFGSEATTGRDSKQLVDECLAIELVSATEMRNLFPDAELLHERLFGLTKSIISVR